MTQSVEELQRKTQQLVQLAQAGDADALNELLTQVRPYVSVLARRRLNDAHEADELTQDVLVKIARKIGQLRQPGAFAGWVRQIVSRLASNRLARQGMMIACDPETLVITAGASSDPWDHLQRQESVALIREGLQRLGRVDRQTLEAFYLRGQSLAEMSDRFSAPVGTIKRRLHTARKRLAQEMDSLQAV